MIFPEKYSLKCKTASYLILMFALIIMGGGEDFYLDISVFFVDLTVGTFGTFIH